MLKRTALTLATMCALMALPHAQAVWKYMHQPFVGKYTLYGGVLDDAHAPAPGDVKVVMNITDAPAKEMFNAIGPDVQTNCADKGFRLRQRDMLLCRYRPKDGYWCTFGFDLSTGLSIGGSVGGAACQPPG
jgi:hypothetical protein